MATALSSRCGGLVGSSDGALKQRLRPKSFRRLLGASSDQITLSRPHPESLHR